MTITFIITSFVRLKKKNPARVLMELMELDMPDGGPMREDVLYPSYCLHSYYDMLFMVIANKKNYSHIENV